MSILSLVSALLLSTAVQKPNIFPLPASIHASGVELQFNGLAIKSDPKLSNETKVAREIVGAPSNADATLRLKLNPALSNEGYTLTVTKKGIEIDGATSAGVFYGLQTLRQILFKNNGRWIAPQVQIKDQPRFPWRGMMLDVSRHFFPKADIIHFLDLLSRYKINTFHWHLVDDGGWRLEIKKYPNLTDFGAWRTPSDGTFPEYTGLDFPGKASGKKLYGGFYTQEDVKEIVRYAESRHINIVPEIEMPGHNLGATMSYPWLVCSPDLQPAYRKEYGFAYPNVFCAGKESTFKFVEGVLDEVMTLFPSKVIHIGGDEVDKFLWTRCADCKARMAKEGLTKPEQLESYFIARVEKYLNAHGRQIIGWDEILEGGLAPNAKVMSWRGEAGGIEAAKQHHYVVMTPWDQCYFDHANNILPIDAVLAYDPAPPTRGPEMAKYVLGGQASIWTETLPTRSDIEDRMFPRMLAMSQILWSKERESSDSFIERLNSHLPGLYALAPGMHLSGPVLPLSVVEPGTSLQALWPGIPGTQLRYTIDGSVPTPSSAQFKNGLKLVEGQSISLALTNAQTRISDVTRVSAGHFAPAEPSETQSGLHARLFSGSFSKVPDFHGLIPTTETTVEKVAVFGDQKANFAIEYTGYLAVPKSGRYRIYCSSDDGSVVWLGGFKIIDNDGYHGMGGQSATVNLNKGLYPLTIGYFQGTEDAKITLELEGPGIARQTADGRFLRHK